MQLRSQFCELTQPLQQGSAVRPALSEGQSSLKPMIMRLETALGCDDLAQSMVLVSPPRQPGVSDHAEAGTVSFMVGYSGSAHSQAALDLTLCMAHQTRLATQNPVLVHVVYVVEQTQSHTIDDADRILWQARSLASEWQSPLNAHLRVGPVATALSQVAAEMQATALLLGCRTADHPLVQQLAPQIICPVLGLP